MRAEPTGEGQRAAWQRWDSQFDYHGTTTDYSCNGLRSLMRRALLELGVRSTDLSIDTSRCGTDDGTATPFPRLSIHASSLAPATPGNTDSVDATWKPVTLSGHAARDDIPCELYAQMLHTILPKLATRAQHGELQCSGQGAGAIHLEVLTDASR